MDTHLQSTRRLVSLLLLGAALAGSVSAQTAASPELLQRIEAARTPADFEALATYYEQQAAAAHGIAEQHRKMAKSYQAMIAGGRGAASMPAHCNAIAAKNDGLAKDYEAMAVAYRQLAKPAKP